MSIIQETHMPLADISNVASQPPKNKPTSHNEKVNNDQAAYWKSMYVNLHHERVTVPEAHLEAFVHESNKNQRALKNYALHLEHELGTLRAENTDAAQEFTALKAHVQTQEAKMKRQEKEIEMYKRLTSMAFSEFDGTNEKFGAVACTVVNEETKIQTKFQLESITSSSQEESIKYKPLENPDVLPEFLRDEIEFDETQFPALMQNVLKSLFPEED